MVALDLYDYTDAYYHDDFDKVLHVGNIIMTVTSGFMILITVSEIHLGSSSIIIICLYYVAMATVLCG